MSKIMKPEEAVRLIKDEACIWVVSSGGGINEPRSTLEGIKESFLKNGTPAKLTLCHSSGIGDGNGGGSDFFAYEGMTKKVIGSHWSWSPKLGQMARENKIEAYVLPQGVMVQLARQIAGAKPGLISHVGLGTFVDPRIENGALNEISKEKLSEIIEIGGEEYIFYKSFPIDVTIIRGTTADEDGNITMEHEGIVLESLSAAQAAKNSGGIVIAQVKRIAKSGSLHPAHVKVPGILVDAVVVDPKQKQSFITEYEPAFTGEIKLPKLPKQSEDAFSVRSVIGRRAAQELKDKSCVNLGFGIPDTVANVANKEGISDRITLTVEQGVIGGVPALGINFSLGYNPIAIIDEPYQFDWYDGGGLDIAYLSFAEFDKHGNVNVSKFASRVTGVGGFINISQNARKVVFMGTFTASGIDITFENRRVNINKEGKNKKLVDKVEQISFSGDYARRQGKEVLYVTERAVFSLEKEGIALTEIAPGIDIQKDILAQMDFQPVISKNLKIMDSVLFSEDSLGINKTWEDAK